MQEWFLVGKIVNTHGVRGEVRVMASTDFPEQRFAPGSVLHAADSEGAEKKALTVATHRIHKAFDLLTFEDYNNINEVLPLKGKNLYVHADYLEALDEGEYYYHEIIGSEVFKQDGTKIGKVTKIQATGANDVWYVSAGGKEILIPYIEDVVKSIDPAAKEIIIEPIPGLLPDEN